MINLNFIELVTIAHLKKNVKPPRSSDLRGFLIIFGRSISSGNRAGIFASAAVAAVDCQPWAHLGFRSHQLPVGAIGIRPLESESLARQKVYLRVLGYFSKLLWRNLRRVVIDENADDFNFCRNFAQMDSFADKLRYHWQLFNLSKCLVSG